jgi:hypothetical protein
VEKRALEQLTIKQMKPEFEQTLFAFLLFNMAPRIETVKKREMGEKS